MTDSQRNILYRYILITVLLLTAYGNTLNHGFVWDDINIIVDSPLTEKLSNIPRFFISEDTAEGPTGYYRPITYVSFALDRALWGLNPIGFNITNLLLHILVALLFYRVVALLFKNENLALAAALIFSLHPIAGETVNFHAGGRNTLLCACFSMLSLLFYSKRKHLPAVIFFILAIFSKEFALLLPALFFLYDRFISREKVRWIYHTLCLIAIICYLGLRSFAVAKNANLFHAINITDSIWIVPQIIGSYLDNMALPVGLKTMYDVNTKITWFSFISYSILLITLIAAAFVLRKQREIMFSIAVFLLFLLPVTNIFPLGIAMIADRYAYFASFGFSLALAYCICLAKKQVVIVIVAILCVVFITIDINRNGFWKDELSLFTQMIKDAPDMSVGFQNLGYAYFDKGDFANADKYLTVAYAKKDVNARMLFDSAAKFREMGRLDKAITVLNKQIALEPDNPQPFIMTSRIYEKMGNKVMAKSYHDKATALNPRIFEMLQQRAIFACRQGEELMARHKIVEAERLFKEAVSIDPLFVPALIDMGSLSAEKGDLADSVKYFSKAVTLDPLNPAAHYNLSLVYESLGKMPEAQEEMTKFKGLEARFRQRGYAEHK
jgi:tetratricopeptide (TPR) repeat protein